MAVLRGANKRILLAGIAVIALIGSGSYAAVAAGKPGPQPDPDAKLTSEQRDTLYRTTQQDFQRRYAEWLQSPAAQAQDLHRLERQKMAASYAPGQPTLEAAKRKADVAVTGVVSGVRFEPGRTLVTVRVDRRLKGQPSNEIVVSHGGGLFPAPDFQHAYLAIDESTPPLLPGDRAALLLQRFGPGDGFIIQPFTGEYIIANGRVHATPGNPFGQAVEGQSEDDFISRLGE